jgi:hypothetical protein
MDSALFVTDEDVVQAVLVVEEFVVNMQDGAARVTEEGIDTFL